MSSLLETLRAVEWAAFAQSCPGCGYAPPHDADCGIAAAIATVEKMEALAAVQRMCNDPYCEPCGKGENCKPDAVNAAELRALLNGDAP